MMGCEESAACPDDPIHGGSSFPACPFMDAEEGNRADDGAIAKLQRRGHRQKNRRRPIRPEAQALAGQINIVSLISS